MKSETYWMNIRTGSVDTEENWEAEGFTAENATLVKVEKDSEGDWQES